MPTPCPICASSAHVQQGGGDYQEVRCQRCGTYSLTGTMSELLSRQPLVLPQAAYASSWIYQRQGIRIASQHEELLRTIRPPAVDEQAILLLRAIAKAHPTPGERFQLGYMEPALMASAWAVDQFHMVFLILDYLVTFRQHLMLDNSVASQNAYSVHIAPSGWAYLDATSRSDLHGDMGFIAMWFNDATIELRDSGLKPAVAAAGYRPTVVDEIRQSDRIDAAIVATIRQSRILVADIRSRRGGVYFEAGLAQGFGIPVFWTCEQRVLDRNRVHFDVRQFPFTPWTPNDWPKFVAELSTLIIAVAGKGPYSP